MMVNNDTEAIKAVRDDQGKARSEYLELSRRLDEAGMTLDYIRWLAGSPIVCIAVAEGTWTATFEEAK